MKQLGIEMRRKVVLQIDNSNRQTVLLSEKDEFETGLSTVEMYSSKFKCSIQNNSRSNFGQP